MNSSNTVTSYDYPLVNVQLLLPAGGQYDPPGQSGLASLHGALLDEGTATRTALEVASTIERLGGFLGTGADWDVAYVSTTVLRTQLEAGLELVADLVLRSTFPGSEVEPPSWQQTCGGSSPANPSARARRR